MLDNVSAPLAYRTMKQTLEIEELLQKIVKVIAQWDGKSIERIANQLLTQQVTYIGDDFFEVEGSEER